MTSNGFQTLEFVGEYAKSISINFSTGISQVITIAIWSINWATASFPTHVAPNILLFFLSYKEPIS